MSKIQKALDALDDIKQAINTAYEEGYKQSQRTWVGLTQQEVQEIHDTYHKRMGPQEFAAMVEAKLKEKNT